MVLGRGITFAFFRAVGKTLLRIEKLYISIGERLNYIQYEYVREMVVVELFVFL